MDIFNQLFKQSTINQLEPNQVHTMISKSPRPFLLDVRTQSEYKAVHINGSESIPLDEISSQLSHIPKSREIICIC